MQHLRYRGAVYRAAEQDLPSGLLAALPLEFRQASPYHLDTTETFDSRPVPAHQVSVEGAYADEPTANTALANIRHQVATWLGQYGTVQQTNTTFGVAQLLRGNVMVQTHVGRVRCRCSNPWRVHVAIAVPKSME